jgi:type I restriction enzyme M protein
LPEGRKSYSKTKPMQFEEFDDCIKWWGKRKENEKAWRVKATDIVANNYNLDIKNPNAKEDLEHLPPEQLVEDIMKKEQRIAEIMDEIRHVLVNR